MAVTQEQINERAAAKAADDAVAQEEAEAQAAEADAQRALDVAKMRTAEVAERRQQSAARVKAADGVILAGLKQGETRALHPTDIPVLIRDGDTLREGTLYSIHADPTP